jgi:hypothetical protein
LAGPEREEATEQIRQHLDWFQQLP